MSWGLPVQSPKLVRLQGIPYVHKTPILTESGFLTKERLLDTRT